MSAFTDSSVGAAVALTASLLALWGLLVALGAAVQDWRVHRRRTAALARPLRKPSGRRRGAASRARAGWGEAALVVIESASKIFPIGEAERRKVVRLLMNAGFHGDNVVAVFLAVKLGTILLAAAVAGWLLWGSALLGPYPFAVVLAALGVGVGMGVMVEQIVVQRGARRSMRIEMQLPDGFDLLAMCLETGLSFERALLTTANELEVIEPALTREFRILESELRVGAQARSVLQEFREKTPVEGLRDFCVTLMQSERYGTPLGQAVQTIARRAREQQASRIQSAAERLPVFMTLPMLLLILPGMMVLVAGPMVLTALDTLGSYGSGFTGSGPAP